MDTKSAPSNTQLAWIATIERCSGLKFEGTTYKEAYTFIHDHKYKAKGQPINT